MTSDFDLVKEIIGQVLTAITRIERRFMGIGTPNDFVSSDQGLDRLDSIAMMLIAIGENTKNLDKVTEGQLLPRFPQTDWKGVKGMRDIISHHYFDINAEVIFSVCRKQIPILKTTFESMLVNLQT